jgi:hypothetical protein
VKRLRQKRLDLDERHAAAIAQHYFNTAKIHTWLIDMTSDPFVVLWFASLDGEEGDLGIVESIYLAEWNSIADIPGNPLGPVRLLYPANVPRIKAQHGLFLEAPSGVFWPQYFKQSLKFHQKKGLVFEDPDIGVTEQILMPADDELLRFAERFAQDQSLSEAELESEGAVVDQLFVDFTSPEPYLSLARHTARRWHDEIPASLDNQLRFISQFHATLLHPKFFPKVMGKGAWSIRRFVLAVEYAAINAEHGFTEDWRSVVERAVLQIPEIADDFRAAQDCSERRFS